MKFIVSRLTCWYEDIESRQLAKMPAAEREEILALDRSLKAHKWRYGMIAVALWLGAATVFRFAVSKATWVESLLVTLLLLGVFGFAMLAAWFGHAKFKLGIRALSIAIVLATVGAVFGGMFGSWLRTGSIEDFAQRFGEVGVRVIVGGAIFGLLYATLLGVVVHVRRRLLQTRYDELQRQADSERTARQLADARLKLLQAQVEPHFLFNTLASVQQLAEGRAPEAARLTSELIHFLRAGLVSLREETTNLKREFDMAAAYLAIMRTRMGSRLQTQIVLPPELSDVPVPPAMLISLVENAIKHGLEPSPVGGTLALTARVVDDAIEIAVRDDGVGLSSMSSGEGGVGLSNIRERLTAIYGNTATLDIQESAPHGVLATIRIPQHPANQHPHE
jgi:signal transduction histidine kinase